MSRQFVLLALTVALLGWAVYLIVRIGTRMRDNAGGTVVRCREGHVFSTTWIPGVSFNAIRLSPTTRYQWCPVGRHWTVITKAGPFA